MPDRVLVVDDEPMVREVLVHYLRHEGYDADEAGDGVDALEMIQQDVYDLVLLDVMLPTMSGLDVLKIVRKRSGTPVIMLTARGAELERVEGLELGADDYVVKPFSPREVTARVRSVLRRSRLINSQPIVTFGDVIVDLTTMTVERNATEIDLTRREFELLGHLVRRPNQVVSRDELLTEVWGSSVDWQDPATVTVHIGRLRRKLEDDPADPQHFITVFGSGYRFVP